MACTFDSRLTAKRSWKNYIRFLIPIILTVHCFICYTNSETTSSALSFIQNITNSSLRDLEENTPIESLQYFNDSLSLESVTRSAQESLTKDLSEEANSAMGCRETRTNNKLVSLSVLENLQSSSLTRIKMVGRSSYSCLGDINLGALPLTQWSKSPGSCPPLPSVMSSSYEEVIAIRYAVESVNSDPNILPGINLGFVQLSTCSDTNVALAKSLSYLPRVKVTLTGGDTDICSITENNTACTDSNNINCNVDTSYNSNITTEEEMPFYDVIGIVGPAMSSETVGVSRLMGVAEIPVIGTTSTSDEISDKSEHPYFMRVVAPDKYQTEAMMAFLEKHGWSYFSVLYQSGSYGQTAFENIRQLAGERGFCIAYSHKFHADTDVQAVARGLLAQERARVVISFIYESHAINLLRTMVSINASGHFIWLASDAWLVDSRAYPDDLEEELLGAFSFKYQSQHVPDFFRALTRVMLCYRDNFTTGGGANCVCSFNGVDQSYDMPGECANRQSQKKDVRLFNAVMEAAWKTVAPNCETKGRKRRKRRACLERADMDEIKILSKLPVPAEVSLYIDAVWTLALATHQLISDHCPGAKGQTARDCITGPILLQYLRNTSFNGSSGVVKFDDNGDAAGKYVIYQTMIGPKPDPLGLGFDGTTDIGLNAEPVAYYDISTRDIIFTDKVISWDHLRILNTTDHYSCLSENYTERLHTNRIVKLSQSGTSGDHNMKSGVHLEDRILACLIPESVCSKPCSPGHFVIYREPAPCCWECRSCRENERLIKGNTSCETCPQFTWPDPDTQFQSCRNIPLTYTQTSEALPTLQTLFGTLALVICFIIIGFFIYFRESRVIKAASRELSVLQMLATIVGFMTVILFQMPPSQYTCSVLYFLFCLSFASLYCPLLVKAIRIYRIFENTTKSTRPPRYISPVSQVVMTLTLISVQVILCLYIFIVYQPTAVRFQPVLTEKLVELSCDLTVPGLTSFLAYNLVLVALCSVFAFKTRKLPDNFNESQFTCMCVTTTLVIWGAFVPTYFTSTFGRVRVLLLSLALLLNHTVALVFLFAPKVYAAAFVPDENFVGSRIHPEAQNRFNMNGRGPSTGTGSTGSTLAPPVLSCAGQLAKNRVSAAVQPQQDEPTQSVL